MEPKVFGQRFFTRVPWTPSKNKMKIQKPENGDYLVVHDNEIYSSEELGIKLKIRKNNEYMVYFLRTSEFKIQKNFQITYEDITFNKVKTIANVNYNITFKLQGEVRKDAVKYIQSHMFPSQIGTVDKFGELESDNINQVIEEELLFNLKKKSITELNVIKNEISNYLLKEKFNNKESSFYKKGYSVTDFTFDSITEDFIHESEKNRIRKNEVLKDVQEKQSN